MDNWIWDILFIVIGISITLCIHRILSLLHRISLKIFRIAPWLNFSKESEQSMIDTWAKSNFRMFDAIWIWAMRIAGILLVLFGILGIYARLS